MLGQDIFRVVCTVKILGIEKNLQAGFREIALGGEVKIVVICFEPDLSPAFQKGKIGFQLPCVGQAALVVLGGGPGIAEIDIQPLDLFFRREQPGKLFNIVIAE